jgi:XTP/dITP diphosphohydrolase
VRLVVASQNHGKLAELAALAAGLPLELVPIDQLRGGWSIDEPGQTFEENAAHKARAAAEACGLVALADDSGLEVDALSGAPGVRSARFAGLPRSDERNNAKLLAALAEVPLERRSARFRCVLALAHPDGAVQLARGSCVGRIALLPRGSGGFGYDPLFVVDGAEGRTMAELASNEKNRFSHRARALAALRPLLLELR